MHVHTPSITSLAHPQCHTQPHTYIRLTFTPLTYLHMPFTPLTSLTSNHTPTCPTHSHPHTHTPSHTHPTQLVLRDNDITVVPKEIYGCTKLKTLHLQVNQLNVLPPELSEHQCCLTRFVNKGHMASWKHTHPYAIQ